MRFFNNFFLKNEEAQSFVDQQRGVYLGLAKNLSKSDHKLSSKVFKSLKLNTNARAHKL